MTVQAKFYVKEVRHHATPGSAPVAEIIMAPVFGSYGDGKLNESWSKATPSGELKMVVTNPGAIDYFEPGAAYRLTFDRET